MLTAFICVASLLQSNVSIEIKAERLERAAPALAKAFGMENLAVSPTLKDDVLAFRCKDVRLDEAKSKIETVLNASFIRKEGGWSLEQSDVQRAQDNQKEATAAHVRYSKLVESCQKQLASMGPFDAKAAAKLQSDLKLLSSQEVSYNDDLYYTRLLKVGLQGPLSRFGMRLIGRLKAKDWMPLTRLRPKIVYSLTPTRTQLPMPFPVRDLIDQLNQEQNLWSDLYGNAKLEGPRIREQDGTLTESSTLGEANELRSRYSPDSFAAITCTLNWDEDSVTIFTYDKKGFQSSATSLSIDTIEPLPATKSDLDLDATPFKHTEEMNTFNAAFFGDRSRSITDQPNAALTEKLLNPIEIDPLSISAYPQLAHSAKSKNFVAILDDMYLGERALTFKKIAEDKAGLDVNESADWIEVIHKNPIGRRLDQADRRTASRIFKMIASRKSDLSIEERADFIASQPVMRENDNYIHQIGTLLGRAGIRVFRNPAGHRVYGTLTESERLEVARGPVPVRALSQKMRDVLAFEVLMRPYGTFPSVDQNVVRQANEKESAAIDEYQQLIDTGIYNESTFLLPNGLTGSETLSSKEENTISLVAGAPPGVPDGIGRVMSPESLGRILAQRDYQEFKFSTIGIFQPDLNAIWICNRRSIIITLKPNKLAQFTWTVLDTTLSVNKKLRIEELPESILSRVRDAEAKARREFDRMRAVRSDEKVTPPPQ